MANLFVLPMIFGYVRVSASARYLVEHRWTLDEWIEVEMSSRRTAPHSAACPNCWPRSPLATP